MARVPESQRGPFTPMRFEATIRDCLVVDGELPKALNGGFYRNGPTWRRPSKQGLESAYTIDGMMQGLIFRDGRADRSEEHTSELQSLMRISYAVFCLKK